MLNDSDNMSLPPADDPAPPPLPLPTGEASTAPSPPPPKTDPAPRFDVEPDDDQAPSDWRSRLLPAHALRQMSSCFTSAVIHMLLLLLMALAFTVVNQRSQQPTTLLIEAAKEDEQQPLLESKFVSNEPLPPSLSQEPSEVIQQLLAPDAPNIQSPFAGPAESAAPQMNSQPTPDVATLMQRSRLPVGGGFRGRTQQMRDKLLRVRGGTPQSEQAVARALAWLAAHQMEDGSWRFDHTKSACQGLCRHPGTNGSTTGATGLALLPFLGAGHTHLEGEYKEVVKRGLYYLSSRMIVSEKGGDLQEGTMYSHGIASIAICEAYAMTQDPAYKSDAQQALDFICSAQHPAGGWRYYPGQPGDTTVFGWQLMALKSGRIARLHVPSPVIELAKEYLNSVQVSDGALYGYQKPQKEKTPTAVGLLCRMYLGWSQDDERLARGVAYLDAQGPSADDLYFNYYATQVLIHHGGPQWPRWNNKLREHLIATQAKRGHESGSWYFKDEHAHKAGGRLYNTAMAAMILEVYYRHMPLYGSDALDAEF